MRGITLLLMLVGALAEPQSLEQESSGLVGSPRKDTPVSSEKDGVAPGRRTTTCKCGWVNKGASISRIVNGAQVTTNEFPFLVAIMDAQARQQFCGGSIISPKYVLTAAHCTDPQLKQRRGMYIVAGGHSLKSRSPYHQEVAVVAVSQHSGYDDKNIRNDISILHLAKNLQFTQFVGPVCMPRTRIDVDNKFVKIIGWGRLSHSGSGSTVPMKLTIKSVPLKDCARRYPIIIPSMRSQICTLGDNKGACMGDSGGPVVYLDPETNRYTLVGAVSFGRICGSSIDPSVHTDIAAYYPWVQLQIASQPLCTKA